MITVNAITFWGICLLAALGMGRALWDIAKSDKDEEEKHKGWARSKAPVAPAGYRWVLVKDDDLVG